MDINEIQNICCIGARRLGAFSTLALAPHHPDINFHIVDEDDNLINRWNGNQVPFQEPGLQNHAAQPNVLFTNDIIANIELCPIIFIAIEMRTKKQGAGKKGRIEVSDWKRTVEIIRDNANAPKIIVDKSSVPFEERNAILRVLASGPFMHEVFANPEFFCEGTAFDTLLHPQRRVVFGPRSHNANVQILHDLYYFTLNREVIGDATALDFAKKFNNMLLGCIATLANIGSTFADDLNIDINQVLRVINADARLGAGFISPNVAVGGPALQTDMAYMAEELNHKEIAILFKTFIDVNIKRKENFVKKMLHTMQSLKNTTIVVLGFAFKEETEDVSDSPAIHMCECLLQEEHADLRIYDRFVGGDVIRRCLKATAPQQWAQHVQIMPLNPHLFQGAHAICLMTRDEQFLQFFNFPGHINIIRQSMRNPPYLFDFTGNGAINLNNFRNAGFQVYSSGRL